MTANALAVAHVERDSHAARDASLPCVPDHGLTRTRRANADGFCAPFLDTALSRRLRLGGPRSGAPGKEATLMHTTRFAHHRLDAFHVARDALVGGDALVHKLPRGYAPLGDQLRRALLGAYLQLTEAAARDGNDRRQRFRCARAECNEAAAAVEAALALGLVPEGDADAVLVNLDRLAAMLTRLGGFTP